MKEFLRVLSAVLIQYPEAHTLPFLGYLVLWLGSVILKSRRPKKGGPGFRMLEPTFTMVYYKKNIVDTGHHLIYI